MLDFDPNELPVQRELDDAHERGFRRFLSMIGHKSQIQSHRDRASRALIDLRTRLNEDTGPDYGDPYIAAAYLVRYHLSHCALAYWSFNRLFCCVDIPKVLYLCDVGAGTYASRVGLELALVKQIGDYRKFPEVYFDAIEPSDVMAMAGECFWEAFSEVCNLNLYFSFRIHRECSFTMENFPAEAMRVVSAFHLSLPYNSDLSILPFMYRYGKSKGISPSQQSLRSALNLVKPNAGIFTCHTNKQSSLRDAVDGFSHWDGKAKSYSIPNNGNGVDSRSRFYTDCAETFGFTVPEEEHSPVRTWSRHRFSPPQGILLLHTAPSQEELLRREQERVAVKERRRERERQNRFEAEKRARRQQAEREERERQQRIEAERLEAQRTEAKHRRQEEVRKRQEALARLWDSLCVGQSLEGVVVGVTGFGAFVRVVESIDGLVHISELSNGWVNQVTDIVSVGQSVKVRVLSVNAEKGRLSLSIKAALADPWEEIKSISLLNSRRIGKVQRIEDNKRLVVDIGDNLQGRIHISQLGNWEIGSFHPGDELLVEVLRIDHVNRLIWLRAAEQWSA